MTCLVAAELVPVQIDGELDSIRSEELDRHIDGCPDCENLRNRHLKLSEAIQTQMPYGTVSDGVRRKIEAATIGDVEVAPRRVWLPRIAGTFGVGLAAGIAIAFVMLQGVVRRETLTAELVDSHVRSMMSTVLVDVKSSDKHTVKPWFQGKLDFSPSVVDLVKDGFPLVGGRLESLNGRPAAAIVYRRGRHVLNLYVTDDPSFNLESSDWKGFHLRHFEFGGLSYWAVSDVNAGDLATFERLFRRDASARPL